MRRNPKTPQNAAGTRTDPPVSLPSARGATPAATTAAEPLLEPPHGFARFNTGTRQRLAVEAAHCQCLGDVLVGDRPEFDVELRADPVYADRAEREHRIDTWDGPIGLDVHRDENLLSIQRPQPRPSRSVY